MANSFKQLNDRISQGEGAPEDGDALSTNLSLFPVGAIYIDNNTGRLYARNSIAGNAADWVNGLVGSTPGIYRFVGLQTTLSIDYEMGHVKIYDSFRTVFDTDVLDIQGYLGDVANQGLGTLLTVDDVVRKIILNGLHLNIPLIQNFASNAAAITGGLAVGDLYRTGGSINIVI
jgi:hypothetical protein